MLKNTRNFKEILNETTQYFKAQGLSPIGEGYREFMGDPNLMEEYIDHICEGMSADSQIAVKQLMENASKQTLSESTINGLSPIASLSIPVVRKLWPKTALKQALKNEVTKTPHFVVSHTKPYISSFDENGVMQKVYLPEGLNRSGDGPTKGQRNQETAYFVYEVEAEATPEKHNISQVNFKGIGEESGLFVKSGDNYVDLPLAKTKGSIDSDFMIQSFEYKDDDGTKRTKVLNKKMDIYGKIYEKFDITYDGEKVPVTIVLNFSNRQSGDADLMVACGEGVEYKIKFYVPYSEEYNDRGVSVSFDVVRMDIDVPTGKHINGILPIEFLQDLYAMFSVDGQEEITNLMTNVASQELDLDVVDFLDKEFATNPKYTFYFNTRPSGAFAHKPSEWREELKKVINFAATQMKAGAYLQTGKFVITGHPVDIELITNIDWTFRGGAGQTVDGVDVDYSIGTFASSHVFQVISSPNYPQGDLTLTFIPTDDHTMTYKYYPYSFNVEKGYLDPNAKHVPSIMLTRRYTFASLVPAIARIVIDNNDGMSHFAKPQDDGSYITGTNEDGKIVWS